MKIYHIYAKPIKVVAALVMLASLVFAAFWGGQALFAASVGCYSEEYYNNSFFYQAQGEYIMNAQTWYEYDQKQQKDYSELQFYNELTKKLQESSLRVILVYQDGTEYPIAGTKVNNTMEELPYYSHYEEDYGYKVYLDTSGTYQDCFLYLREQYLNHVQNRWTYLIHGGISLAIMLLAWIVLLLSAGRSASDGTIALKGFHRVPFDVLTVVFAVLCCLITVPIEEYFSLPYYVGVEAYQMLPFMTGLVVAVVAGAVLLVLLWIHTGVARIKGRMLLRSTLIWKVGAWLWRKLHGGVGCMVRVGQRAVAQRHAKQQEGGATEPKPNALLPLLRKVRHGLGTIFGQLSDLFRHLNVIWKLVGITAVLLIVLEFLAFHSVYDGGLFLLMLLLDILILLGVGFFAVQLDPVKKSGERLAGGDLDYKVPTDHMYWDLQDHARNLNAISDGMTVAVEERLKSERMRYELLTNVSHDIKTPLTSIINYVDLLKGEPVPDGPATEYLDVLDRQSAKLKKLITDLIEVSKATTGNITVHAERSHAGELLRQCVGEYAERFQSCNLDVVLSIPEQEPSIYADGRLLWRVFDNLLGNITKYAMPGTRVYMDLETRSNQVVISLKNISRERLNIAADELMERFVRGDASRSTEGSGLGLSIAQSLTELMQGKFELMVDGDLFKVILTFEKMEDDT